MADTQCIYCGEHFSDDQPACPHCGAPSHYQRRGERPAVQRRFRWFVILLAIACLFFILWLPR